MVTETINVRLTRIIDELLSGGIPLEDAMTQFELQYVKAAITRASGNVTEASKRLGVHRNTLMAKVPRAERLLVRVKARQTARRRRRQGRG